MTKSEATTDVMPECEYHYMVSDVKGKRSDKRRLSYRKQADSQGSLKKSKTIMATDQSMTMAITLAVIKTTKEAIMAVRKVDNLVNSARSIHAVPRSGHPALWKTYNWLKRDRYSKLCNFKTGIKNIFMTNNYNMQGSEKVPIILTWLGWEKPRFVQTLNDEDQAKCKTSMGFFKMLCDKFKPQYNETILSLEHYTIAMEKNENAKERMGLPQKMAN